MLRMFLDLNQIKDIQEFHTIVQKIPEKSYLQQNEYIISANSIMGILSLDLSKVVTFISEDNIDEEILKQLQQFSVDK